MAINMNDKEKKRGIWKRGFVCLLWIALMVGIESMPAFAGEENSTGNEEELEAGAMGEAEEPENEPLQTVSANIALFAANADIKTADYEFSPDTGTLIIKTETGSLSWRYNSNISAEDVREVIVEDGVAGLREQAFNRCSNLTTATLPDSITSMGTGVFWYCSSLTSVTIPNNLTEIPDFTFVQCVSLREITLPQGITRIGTCAFPHCESLAEVTVPGTVKSIGQSAFGYCYNLEKIDLPEGLETLGEFALEHCEKLEEVYLPDSITTLGRGNFSGCAGLKKVNLPKNITVIGEGMFISCTSLERIVIPKNVTEIEQVVFFNCKSLNTVIFLSDALPELGVYVFAGAAPNYYKPPNKDYADTLTYVEYEPLVSQPESRTAAKGTAVTFSVQADGLNVTYQWQKKDASGNWQNIAGATGKDYTIAAVDLSTAGSYQCIVEGQLVEEFDAVSQISDTAVLKLENSWKTPLSILGWTYGENGNSPITEAEFGQADYSYSSAKNGVYTDSVPDEAGTWYVKAEVAGTDTYTGLEAVKSFTISKATADITEVPAASDITYGQKLSDSRLSGGTASVAGTFAWEDGSMVPTVAGSGNTSYSAVFTPADTKNWNSITVPVKVTVNKAQEAPRMPETAMAASLGENTVGEVALPAGWKWKEEDAGKELPYQTGVAATAVYDGEDKGNYVTESISVVVTKTICFHPLEKQQIRNAKEANCTADGYTGNVFCTDCQSMTEAGTVIAALGHDYRPQVTAEPTASSEGVMTYICKRCNDSYNSVIDRLPEDGGTGSGGTGSGDGEIGSSGTGSGDGEAGSSGTGDGNGGAGSNGTEMENGKINGGQESGLIAGNSFSGNNFSGSRLSGRGMAAGSGIGKQTGGIAEEDADETEKDDGEERTASGGPADPSQVNAGQDNQEERNGGTGTEISDGTDNMNGEGNMETDISETLPDAGQKKNSVNSGILLLGGAIAVIVIGGLFFWLFLWKRKKEEKEEKED